MAFLGAAAFVMTLAGVILVLLIVSTRPRD